MDVVSLSAFYTEPQLSIQILARKVNFSYESRGYPLPEVLWTDVKGRKIPNAEVSFSQVEHGLFSMHACLTVDCCHELNYTFTVKNQPLGQVIQRHVAFRNGKISQFSSVKAITSSQGQKAESVYSSIAYSEWTSVCM